MTHCLPVYLLPCLFPAGFLTQHELCHWVFSFNLCTCIRFRFGQCSHVMYNGAPRHWRGLLLFNVCLISRKLLSAITKPISRSWSNSAPCAARTRPGKFP